MYAKGLGIEKNDDEAVKWYRRSAENGYAYGQRNLAYKYSLGEGVELDNVEAYAWASVASTNGYKTAEKLRDDLAQKLSEDELTVAQQKATKYLADYSSHK
ncbi:tetratricopeptide repeat protein [Vibrio variabilis]|uniref:tetratricopeptide repeat protein n=1 Tax=Vibrio variabilis TaxID=990271 RepID=UPI000DD58813|nr:SEL1-like repeat protein [Vibrio variabilis]